MRGQRPSPYVASRRTWNISTLPASFLATLDATFAQMRTVGVAAIPNSYMYGKANFSQDVEQLDVIERVGYS